MIELLSYLVHRTLFKFSNKIKYTNKNESRREHIEIRPSNFAFANFLENNRQTKK